MNRSQEVILEQLGFAQEQYYYIFEDELDSDNIESLSEDCEVKRMFYQLVKNLLYLKERTENEK